jgi:hypothetical protein
MRGIATGDLHLGFCSTAAIIGGRNARDLDVERAYAAAVGTVVEQQPDILTISGDCFHHVRPSMHAIIAFRDGIRRVVKETQAHVVVIQGNHDAARTSDTLTPIVVARGEQRVHVITEPRRIRLEISRTGESVSVAAFPFVARGDGTVYSMEPDPDADVNLLLLHASVRGDAGGDKLPWFYMGERALDVGREADKWDVIHVGDFHGFTRLHPTALAFYAGAIERTSSDIWREQEPKGVVAYDTDAGTLRFHELPTREMVDYDPAAFDLAPGAGAVAVNRVLAAIAENPREGAIMRLKLDAFPREERGDIDQAVLREIRRHCLHFELDLRFEKRAAVDMGDVREREGRRISVSHEAETFFREDPPAVRAVVFEHLGVQEGVTA